MEAKKVGRLQCGLWLWIVWGLARASLVAQLVKNRLQCGRPGFHPWVEKIPWRRERLPTPVFWPGEFQTAIVSQLTLLLFNSIPFILGLPCGSAGKGSACSAGDLGSIPGLGRSPGEETRYPLQYSRLENSVHGVAKTERRHFHSHSCQSTRFIASPDPPVGVTPGWAPSPLPPARH